MDTTLDEILKERVIKSLAMDSLGCIIGLVNAPAGCFISTLVSAVRTLSMEAAKRSPANYTDWKLENWRKIYSGISNSDLVSLSDDLGNKVYLPQFVIFNNAELNLNIEDFTIHLKNDKFMIPPDIASLTNRAFFDLDKFLGNRSFEKDNVRLIDCFVHNNTVDLHLQPVDYKDYVATNLALDYSDGERPTLRKIIHNNNVLENLSTSPLGNNLGINFLIITSDNYLIIQRRSDNVAFRSNEFCPSSSGTVSLSDVVGRKTLADCYIVQESKNELEISEKHLYNIELLGITRELIRGGEPELFFIASCTLDFDTVLLRSSRAKEKHEYRNIEKCYFGLSRKSQIKTVEHYMTFYKCLLSLLKKFGKKASIPLFTALALWQMQVRSGID